MLQLTDIYIYPVKSLAGIRLDSAQVELRGLQYDRRWMVVDPESGRFLSQREIPAMTQIGTRIEPPYLILYDRNFTQDCIAVPLDADSGDAEDTAVQVWDDQVLAVTVNPDADEWLSGKLQQPAQLVIMPSEARRITDPGYAPDGQYVSFADGFPFLIIGQASLDDLNSRLEKAVSIHRFRPNLVFSGGLPYEEDQWNYFRIGDQEFQGVKPCGRCIMTTIDQKTGIKGAEPLKTLASYRLNGKKICFGQNVIWTGTGTGIIRTGDLLERLPDE